jgi:hypothetical protein
MIYSLASSIKRTEIYFLKFYLGIRALDQRCGNSPLFLLFFSHFLSLSFDLIMAFASTQSSSSSSSIRSGQSTTMASIPSYKMLNHTLLVKLDQTNYILWRFYIGNVVFVNGLRIS